MVNQSIREKSLLLPLVALFESKRTSEEYRPKFFEVLEALLRTGTFLEQFAS